MGLLFLIAGVLFFTAAYRGGDAPTKLTGILKSDFTGPNNFFVWALALGAVAGIGYIPKLRPLANALFVLVLLALILAHSNKNGDNFVTLFFKQIRSTEGTTK
jgi:hypothetical protein